METPKAATAGGALRAVDAGDGVRILEVDVPGHAVNLLTAAVLGEIERALQEATGDPAVRALVVMSGKPGSGTFIAGADIDEIKAVTDPARATELARRGQEILGGFARLEKPTVAAIGGTCLGGGTELALACDLRIAADDPHVQIGLPEVLLGILPGFGGTQRLPRLVGIPAALDLILTGKRIDARKAAQIGLVHRLASPPLLREEAVGLAREAIRHGKRWRPARRRRPLQWLGALLLERTGWGRSFIRARALKGIRERAGSHYPAPPLALRSVLDGFARRLDEGLKLEAELVGGLVAGEVSKSLIRLFQASEALRREPRGEHPEDQRLPAERRAPRRAAILGAGVMGGAIAALLARHGFRVRIKDIRPEALSTALAQAAKAFDELVGRRRMTRGERDNCLSAISATTEYTGLRGAELVIEAVVEDLEVKQKVLREVEPHLAPGAIFATNTSALSVTRLQDAACDPERVVGLHFFNPVHRMPLVEVIHGQRTGKAAARAASAVAREIGKYPVRVKDGPGFLVNRLFMPYLHEAALLFLDGHSIATVDAVMREFGFPMGPFEVLDEVGLDVAAKVSHILHQELGERAAPVPLLDRLVGAEKLLGKKGGAGFYLHGKKRRRSNPRVQSIQQRAKPAPLAPPDPAAWERRLLYPMVSEAARCLEEGIVQSASDVDVATVMGMAFPPFRGGLLSYADRTGLKAIVETLRSFAQDGSRPGAAERYRPAPLLDRLAAEGGRFEAYVHPEAHHSREEHAAPVAAPVGAGG